MALDGQGAILVADSMNHRIRLVAAGQVTTFAGSGGQDFLDGIATTARFNTPYSVAVSALGAVYVADQGNHRIRIIASGLVSTIAGTGAAAFADGPAATAAFKSPSGIVLDPAGTLYIADQGNHRIRVLDQGIVSTLAGSTTSGFIDGPTTIALFNAPTGVAVSGTKVYVADRDNHRIRVVVGGNVTTLAGTGIAGFANGPLGTARLSSPTGVAVHTSGKILIADEMNQRIRVVAP